MKIYIKGSRIKKLDELARRQIGKTIAIEFDVQDTCSISAHILDLQDYGLRVQPIDRNDPGNFCQSSDATQGGIRYF